MNYVEPWEPILGDVVRIRISPECSFHGLALDGLIGFVHVVMAPGERASYVIDLGVEVKDLLGHRFGVHPLNAPPGAIVWLAAIEMQPAS